MSFVDRTAANLPVTRQETSAVAALELQPFLSGLSSPLYITNAGDGTNRLFIVEQGGIIKVVQPGSTTPTVFLNITSRVLSGGERGLLGLAFHPQYSTNRRFFVNYTRQTDGATVIAEYTASTGNPNVANTTENVFLVIAQPFSNHNGGMIEFGQDGFLYIGMGDGGSANDPGNRAQNINDLLGKMLRINVDVPDGATPYSSPPTNPFFGSTPGRDEIYAVGLRNPFRWSFDRVTGQLIAGDVGQGAREEVDIITLGGNYGWRVFEGTLCTNLGPPSCASPGFTHTPPITEYSHSGGRCSITGGYVYRGSSGTFAAGTYLFADFCTGEIFQFFDSTQSVLMDTSLSISSFGEDEAGELYVVNLGGTVLKMANTTPACSFSINPTSQSFGSGGGSGSVAVTAGAGCNWTAQSNAGFITVTGGASGSGNGTVNFSVAANTSTSPRSGTITIAGQTFTVNQSGAPAPCSFSINPTSQSFAAGGGTGTVGVTAGAGCAWTAQSNAGFITITSGGSGSGNGTVNYSVAANTSSSQRSGTMTIAGQTFTVTQAGTGGGCTFSINPTSQSFAAAGGSSTVAVTAGASCNWTAQSNAAFITITAGSSGTGNGTVNFSVAANSSASQRTGTMTIAGQTFTVTQAGTGGGCTFTISPSSASVRRAGGPGTTNVLAGAGCNWTAVSNVPWITITSGSSGSGNGSVGYTVAENPTGTTRSGTVTIAGKTFTVKQAGF
jgi:glucose/arabinose dehydrogenase